MCGEDESDFEMLDGDGEGLESAASQSADMNETLVEDLEPGKDRSSDLNILIATDIHVGYGEGKPHRSLDSINTFEEVLQIAKREEVDMILLGGDLFHENNPTRDMQHRVVQLLRKYCLSDREVAMEFVSDASVNFNHSRFDRVNYEDSNLNVGLPIFTIHGNHDDMAGKGLTALDVLHETGLINLFGKFENIDEFEVTPILLKKGTTRLALYGIGSQRDDRLCRSFQEQSIKFLRPTSDANEWFSLLTLHQNRPRRATHRTTGGYLPEQYIPSFFDFVVWGHEHECIKECKYTPASDAVGDGFFILQPGSTIATSLTKEEALPKHVFLATIRGRKFKIKPIPLQTTRQIYVDEVVLSEAPAAGLPTNGVRNKTSNQDEMAVKGVINRLIARAEKERGPKQPLLPLIRLKVTYSGPWAHMQPINGRRLGSNYMQAVANASEMITTKKIIAGEKKTKKFSDRLRGGRGRVTAANVEEVIARRFDALPWEDRLTVFSHSTIGSALSAFADEDVSAVKANKEFDTKLKSQIDDVKSRLRMMDIPPLNRAADGNLHLESFERVVRGDLTQLKKMWYVPTEVDDEEEEMEESKPDRSTLA